MALPMGLVGLLLTLLALWVLYLRPTSRLHRALALLLVTRGLIGILAWWDNRLLSLPDRLSTYLIIALPFAAANVAYLYWRRNTSSRPVPWERPVVRLTIFVLLAVVETAYLLDHSLYLDSDLNDGPFVLFFPAALGSFAVVGLAAALAWRGSSNAGHRQGHFVVALAFLVEPAYETGLRIVTWASTASTTSVLELADLVLRALVGTVVLAALAIFSTPRAAPDGRMLPMGAEERTAAFLLGVALATGLAVFLGFQLLQPPLAATLMWLMNAFWLLAMAIGLVYAVIRYRVFDSERLMSFAIRQSTFAAIVGVLFVVTSETLEVLIDVSDQTAAIGVAVALAAGFRLLQRLTATLVQRFVPLAEEPADVRPVEVYRAALEGLLVDGEVTRRERMALDALVAKLRLDPEEARRLEEEVLVRFAATG